jgi:hypothetical protein
VTVAAIKQRLTGGAIKQPTTLVNRDMQHLFAMPAVQIKLLLERCRDSKLS